MENGRNIILFDDECVFCNRIMITIFNRDKKGIFYYGSLKTYLSNNPLKDNVSDKKSSIIYIKGSNDYRKSLAILEILYDLGKGYRFIYHLSKLFPIRILDCFYDLVAKNRYRISGKMECRLPSAQMKERIIN